jgi:hypothetical protein
MRKWIAAVTLFSAAALAAAQTGAAAQTAAAAQAAPPKIEVKTIAPRPADVATIDGIINAFYEVVSGPKGQPRDWARDRTLYIPDVRFVPIDVDKDGAVKPRISTHQQFVEGSDASLTKQGFFEAEIHRVTERFGPIAHVWSTYAGRRTADGPVILRGINSIELFWDGKRWWIANAIWTDETAENPIPKEYLPK